MLKVQFQKVFENSLAFRVLEQDVKWYRLRLGTPGLNVFSRLKSEVNLDNLSIRGDCPESDGEISICIAADPEGLIRKHIENLRNAARWVYGSEATELKPGVYTDDVLVEVTNNKDGDWLRRYLLVVDIDMGARVWTLGKTGSQCGYKGLISYDYVRPIQRDNFTFGVTTDGPTTTVTIKMEGGQE